MKSKVLFTLLLALSLLVTACGPAQEQDLTPTKDTSTLEVPVTGATATKAATDMPATDAVTATVTVTKEAATETASTQVSTVGTAMAVTINVNDDGTPAFLVDDQGRALYVYLLDTPGSNMSACIDAECMSEWPAVLVTGTPTAGEGVDSALLGTITRDNGQMQATYNSWPLYYFDEDVDPGDMNGQGVDGEWFLVSPAGEPIQP